MTEYEPNSQDAALLEQAIAWHVRLTSGHATDDDHRAYAEWLAADPSHMEAAAEVERFSDGLVNARQDVFDAFPEPTIDPPFAVFTNLLKSLQESLRLRPLAFGGTAAALAVAAFLVIGPLITVSHQSDAIETASAEFVTRTLVDGSVVTLGPATDVTVNLSDKVRLVQLAAGVIYLDVVPDARRPFVIRTRDKDIRVVGTRFQVAQMAARLAVSVAEGTVSVGPDADPVILTAGNKVAYETPSSAPIMSTVEPSHVGAWTSGQLVFDDAALGDVAARLNDVLTETSFAVADQATEELRFTGVLQLGDGATVARRLSSFLPITTEFQDGFIILRREQTQ